MPALPRWRRTQRPASSPQKRTISISPSHHLFLQTNNIIRHGSHVIPNPSSVRKPFGNRQSAIGNLHSPISNLSSPFHIRVITNPCQQPHIRENLAPTVSKPSSITSAPRHSPCHAPPSKPCSMR